MSDQDSSSTSTAVAEPESAATAAPRSETLEQLDQLEQAGKLDWLTTAPSWLFSAVVHLLVILALGLMMLPEIKQQVRNLVATTVSDEEGLTDVAALDLPQPASLDATETELSVPTEVTGLSESIGVSEISDAPAASLAVELDAPGLNSGSSDLMSEIGSSVGSGLAGRGEGMRKRLVIERGGTGESEAAVARALAWLAAHQNQDGSWSFDHTQGDCQGRCGNPGMLGNRANLGATGIALMPFLGAGNTHREGKYKEVVQSGLYFLMNNMHAHENVPGALNDPVPAGMYSHGICAIALCEAYGMTDDKGLEGPAQASLDFITYAQDPVGGGWRYLPRQPGDTSVVGWQLMALKSGQLSYLRIDPRTVAGASHFLDTVQTDSGAGYGYQNPPAGTATTAIGLLCRMYMGWKRDHAALMRGVQTLSDRGPSDSDMYYNYYATQVMSHFGGDPWEKWNPKMRDFLVKEQAAGGHELGSWHFSGGAHGDREGGRHYSTALSTMILEVYYRHMPIYQEQAGEEKFQD
ncbi:MAG: prenyltransferase/squalene oxidase repeat-containing protein [Planctomycetia bacterium]|nr:prenyltransferase/squalene oxidase repeat-containing protein [Planctomycetia bacterium]